MKKKRGRPPRATVASGNTIRLRIAELREAAGLDRLTLATAAGVSRATLNALENGTAQGVTFGVLSRIAAVLNEHPAALIADTRSSMRELSALTRVESSARVTQMTAMLVQLEELTRLQKEVTAERKAARVQLDTLATAQTVLLDRLRLLEGVQVAAAVENITPSIAASGVEPRKQSRPAQKKKRG